MLNYFSGQFSSMSDRILYFEGNDSSPDFFPIKLMSYFKLIWRVCEEALRGILKY